MSTNEEASTNGYKYGQPNAIGANLRADIPVFFDLHAANLNDKPPVTLFTGQPGSGKTFGMLWILSLAALQGAAVVGIDWKGDLLKIINIEDTLGVPCNIKTIDPSDPNNVGILDPFVIFDNAEKPEDAKADIRNAVHAMMHAIVPDALSDNAVRPWVEATITDVIKSRPHDKSMDVFLNMLIKVASDTGNEQLKGIALTLINTLSEGAGVTLLSEPDRKPARYFKFAPGVTVIDLSRLNELPRTVADLKDPSKAVGQAILTMITLLVRQSMSRMPKNIKKVVAIDEAWSIIANQSGANLIKSTALLGRSNNLALVLGTQSYAHIFNASTGLDVSLISTHFAFANSRDDATVGARAMGLKTDGKTLSDDARQVVDAIANLPGKGSCIMQDMRKRRGYVQIVVWLPSLVKAFSSNPYDEAHQQQIT